jgi:hypothetical protein
MINNKEADSFSTAKTNSSSINKDTSSKNEEDELYHKTRTRGGVKHKINNFQPGRATISVPLSSFSGISHNASFQSKLLFFNGGKPRPKFQHIPYAHEKVPEDSKKKNPLNKFEKKTEKKVEKKVEKKNENDFDDIDSNININQIMESKNKNTNNDNKNTRKDNKNNNKINTANKNKNSINTNNKKEEEEEEDYDFKLNLPKKNTIYVPSSQTPSLSLDYKIPGFSKIQKEEKNSTKKSSQLNTIEIKNLKSLEDQWSFQKILLDYNILDFTSKSIIINISFSDI